MLNKIIHYSLHNRLVVVCAAILLLIAGTYTAMHTEVDVFPRPKCTYGSNHDRGERYGCGRRARYFSC